MGGKALEKYGVQTRRVNKEVFDSINAEVIGTLRDGRRPAEDFTVIPAYRSKETFGDSDILYTGRGFSEGDIRELFPWTKAIHSNGDVISFEYKDFQIDLINSDHASYDYALNYFSYNDIAGNLVGKIAHRFGLKHGHDGLWYPIRDDKNNLVGSVLVTRDYYQALEFFDLDVQTYKNGFETLEDGFEWVSKSKYFNPKSYELENLNHIAKVRDKKRTTYRTFLEWCAERQFNTISMSNDKSVYMPMVVDAFPSSGQSFNSIIKDLAFKRMMKEIFSGDIVREITGLDGIELGKFMSELKKHTHFRPEFLYMQQHRVREMIQEFWDNYSEN